MAAGRVLVVGIGGGGSRIAAGARCILDCGCITISTDGYDRLDGCDMLHVESATLNPSIHSIRGAAAGMLSRLEGIALPYDTVLVAANLAGSAGIALAPLVLMKLHQMGKKTASFVIMPFRYEKDRLFQAGIALKRVRLHSQCTIILDNDSLLQCNPDLSLESCYEIGNSSLVHMTSSLGKAILPESCIVSAGRPRGDLEESLRDSLKMLYGTTSPSTIDDSIIYVSGSAPVGVIESVSQLAEDVTGSAVKVIAGSLPGVVLVSSAGRIPKFEGYDPLDVIPECDTLDWDYPDSSADMDTAIPQLE